MSVHGKLAMVIFAGALALGLAACGGGGGSGQTDTMETPQSAAALQRAAIAAAIQGARTAVGALVDTAAAAPIAAAETVVAAARDAVADADALTAAEKDAYATTVSVIEGNLVAARSRIATARTELRRAMAEEVAKLRPALDDAAISAIAASVEYGTAPTMTGTIPGTPATTVMGLTTAAVEGSASTEGGWTGGAYRAADGTAADEIVFHTDIEAPGSRPFGGEMGKYGTANGLDADGNLPIVAATDATLIASSAFPTGPGIRTHMASPDGEVEIVGTFDGAEGAYVCTPAANDGCTSSIRDAGGIALVGGGGWKFVPAEDATVLKPDTEYRYFGWWLRDGGGGYAVGAFHGGVGGDAQDFADLATLQGSATYSGPAAGKFVVDPQIGQASAGEFTASATLEVEFGDDTDPGRVTGTVDGFVANGEQVPWSVELQSAGIAADGAIAASGGDTARTVWSIDGQDGAAAGSPNWSGRFHDVDEDKVPQVATGMFEASYGDIGRMIGAFGTNRQP